MFNLLNCSCEHQTKCFGFDITKGNLEADIFFLNSNVSLDVSKRRKLEYKEVNNHQMVYVVNLTEGNWLLRLKSDLHFLSLQSTKFFCNLLHNKKESFSEISVEHRETSATVPPIDLKLGSRLN